VFILHFSDKWGIPGTSSCGSMEECFEVATKMAHSKTAKPLKITKDSDVVVSSALLWQEINKRLTQSKHD
jgi:hypothetical protein